MYSKDNNFVNRRIISSIEEVKKNDSRLINITANWKVEFKMNN